MAHSKPEDEITLACAYELSGLTGLGPDPRTADDVENEARVMLEAIADELREPGGPSITTYVHQGHVGHFLINRSRHADLLVVGNRGIGGFIGLHLGSCSNYVVHHAECPVTVVRTREEDL